MAALNRTAFQDLSNIRLKEAGILLLAREFSGAYYLAGYAVECALKACICKSVNQYDYPDKNLVTKSYTHNIKTLVALAGLDIAAAEAADKTFAANYSIVTKWSEVARYDTKTEKEARDLYSAITNPTNGVIQWIQQSW